jgi:hypothetical protein
MYGFVVSSNQTAIEKNVKLARDLKDKFAFLYAVGPFSSVIF